MGITPKPAAARASAPERRFAVWVSRAGRVLLGEGAVRAAGTRRRSCERRESRPPKYSAEPMEVRRAEGRVPRQRERRGCGEE
jgi:hypothetical protein